MKRNFYFTSAALVALLTIYAGTSSAQRRTTRTPSPAPAREAASTQRQVPAPLASLPASDGVILIEVQRLLNEAMPRALGSDQARLTRVNADLDRFKTRTGIDLRAFERIAFGARFLHPRPGITTATKVALGRGSYDTAAIIAAGRTESKGAFQEQQYGGKTVYIFSLNEQLQLFGLTTLRLTQLAVAPIDAQTLAIGDLTGVRAAIDSTSGRGARVSNELIQLATRRGDALVSFAANLPPGTLGTVSFGDEETARNVAAIRQAYGTMAMTATSFDVALAARTEKPEQAQGLNDAIVGLKQLGGFFIAQLPADKAKAAQHTLDTLKTNVQGNELQLSLQVAQADLPALLSVFKR